MTKYLLTLWVKYYEKWSRWITTHFIIITYFRIWSLNTLVNTFNLLILVNFWLLWPRISSTIKMSWWFCLIQKKTFLWTGSWHLQSRHFYHSESNSKKGEVACHLLFPERWGYVLEFIYHIPILNFYQLLWN
jgi:hypothetical protein